MCERLSRAVVATVLFAGAPAATAQELTFTKIVDSATPIPGTVAGVFDQTQPFFDAVVDGHAVAFIGLGTEHGQQVEGVYLEHLGVLTKVADDRTPVPGSTTNLDFFNRVHLDGDTVVFSTFVLGVYRTTGGPLETVADRTTTIPGDVVEFGAFGDVAVVAGADVLFAGSFVPGFFSWVHEGLHRSTAGVLVAVVDQTTPIPNGAGTFPRVGEIGLDESGFAFALPRQNVSVDDGLYKSVGAGLERIADLSTPVPGGVGTFDSFRRFAYDRGSVAFVATGGGGMGVYTDFGGTLERVADRSTVVPSVGQAFDGFSNRVAFSGGRVAFQGFWNPPDGGNSGVGLFLTDENGVIREILRYGDTLDGRVVSRVNISPGALSGLNLVAEIGFSDGHEALYRIGPLFTDGFESGDTLAWSFTTP